MTFCIWIIYAALWQRYLSSSDENFVADVATFDETKWKFDRKKHLQAKAFVVGIAFHEMLPHGKSNGFYCQ